MKAKIVRPGELTSDHIDRWRQFQTANDALRSPFFSPEFTLAVGSARSDARVAVLIRGGEVCGFLPFHLYRSSIAKPIGGPISDYQGVVTAAPLDGGEILKALRLNAYDFNHAPAAQAALAPGAIHFATSPCMDLSAGYEAYYAQQLLTQKHTLKETQRRSRKLEREVGPIRLEMHDDRPEAWDELVRHKNLSYRELNLPSILDVPWVARTLEAIRSYRHRDFAGLLTTLYAGDKRIAMHMGMRTATTICWWFNTYDREMRQYAPGLIMLLETARQGANEGIRLIDLGKGTEAYKTAVCNGTTHLCEGSIERPGSLPGVLRRFQKLSVRSLATMPLGRYEDYPRRAFARAITHMRLPEELR
ncbi:MAG: GNAT family N-acetyltransferase [Rhodospirillales bacterium]|nr:GNAT family N-acetyltransferase [Rhodospirillales bacterium]